MTIANYGQLKAAIADFLNRDDLAAVVPTFVRLAEASFNRRIRSHRQITSASLTIDDSTASLPADWLQTIRLTIDDSPVRVLEQTSMDELVNLRTQSAETPSAPYYFAHNGDTIEVVPTPGQSYTGRLDYFAEISTLSADTDANWLLTRHPDVYLYGSLVNSAPYLKDDNRMVTWAALLESALEEIERETRGARFGSPLKMRLNNG